MSARDEIASELWLVMPSADDDEAREAAAKLLDAYAAEVRSAALREAAESVRSFCAAEGWELLGEEMSADLDNKAREAEGQPNGNVN